MATKIEELCEQVIAAPLGLAGNHRQPVGRSVEHRLLDLPGRQAQLQVVLRLVRLIGCGQLLHLGAGDLVLHADRGDDVADLRGQVLIRLVQLGLGRDVARRGLGEIVP